MAKAFINDENLTDIADAIRGKLGVSTQYLPSEMADAIDSIPIMAQLNRKKYFQSVPAGAASGYATIEQIEGNTVAWNQLVDTGSTSVVVQSGHVYYANINGTASIATSDGTPISVAGGTDIIHDLTLIFGAGNEPSTVADFEAWMAQNIGTLPYYDYNAGELLSVKMQSVKSVGFNQWDEEWEQGGISHGAPTFNNSQIRSKNFIPILSSQDYCYTGYNYMWVCYYDADKNWIGPTDDFKSNDVLYMIKTTPQNAKYIKFKYGYSTSPATTYNNDICINLSDPAKNGTYKPYQSDSADIDVTTITGINTATNVREMIFPNGMKQADRDGNVKDTLDLRSDTATVNVGSRAYQSGDESDTSVITDGTTTYYALTTPVSYTDLQDANGNPLNPRYKVEQGGTEQVLPANTSTPTTVAPTLTTTYTKDNN